MKKYKDALLAAERALELNPKSSLALVNKGNALCKEKNMKSPSKHLMRHYTLIQIVGKLMFLSLIAYYNLKEMMKQ